LNEESLRGREAGRSRWGRDQGSHVHCHAAGRRTPEDARGGGDGTGARQV